MKKRSLLGLLIFFSTLLFSGVNGARVAYTSTLEFPTVYDSVYDLPTIPIPDNAIRSESKLLFDGREPPQPKLFERYYRRPDNKLFLFELVQNGVFAGVDGTILLAQGWVEKDTPWAALRREDGSYVVASDAYLITNYNDPILRKLKPEEVLLEIRIVSKSLSVHEATRRKVGDEGILAAEHYLFIAKPKQ